jgi:hypothetical protein
LPPEKEVVRQCLSTIEFKVRYSNTQGPCPGGHTCNRAKFDMVGNITVMFAFNLDNASGNINGVCSGCDVTSPNFYLTPLQCYNIAYASGANGRVQFKVICKNLVNGKLDCHSQVSWITMTSKTPGQADKVVYNGCPKGNLLILNPCTGQIFTSM